MTNIYIKPGIEGCIYQRSYLLKKIGERASIEKEFYEFIPDFFGKLKNKLEKICEELK
jgi:hypothetical protein